MAALEDRTVAPMTKAYPVLAIAHSTARRKNSENAAFLNLRRGQEHNRCRALDKWNNLSTTAFAFVPQVWS